ncbi:MAG: 7-carboxy-7-deazaguanine synthase, partial [Isosphaeraceae bacterium]
MDSASHAQRLKPLAGKAAGTLVIHEIYRSLQGETMSVDDVVARTLALGDDLVEITGGEPLLQLDVYPLMSRLADAGKT